MAYKPNFDHLTNLEQAWLHHGDLIRAMRKKENLNTKELAMIMDPTIPKYKLHSMMDKISHFETGSSSGASILPLLLKALKIMQPPSEYSEIEIPKPKPKSEPKPKPEPEPVKQVIQPRPVAMVISPREVGDLPDPEPKTCPHCGQSYTYADIDLSDYFARKRICPHCRGELRDHIEVALQESSEIIETLEMPIIQENNYEEDIDLNREQILDEAKAIITTDRDEQYGSVKENFQTISDLWSSYLGYEIELKDVSIMMVLLKIAKMKTGQPKPDNWVDAIGYLALGAELVS